MQVAESGERMSTTASGLDVVFDLVPTAEQYNR